MDCMAAAELVRHHVPTLGQAPSEHENQGEMLVLGLGMVCEEEGASVNGTWSFCSKLSITS